MLPKFLTSLNAWVTVPLKTGLFFWLAGLVAWLYNSLDWVAVHHLLHGGKVDSLMTAPWQPVWLWLNQDVKAEHATVFLFVLLFVMMLGNVVVSRLNFPVLRFLEGYGWLWRPFRSQLVKLVDAVYYAPRGKEFHAMDDPETLSGERLERYLELENEQLYLLDVDDRLPTRLGNILRSHERRPNLKYGLDAIVCWPHLWLLMPENAQKDLATARQSLDESVQIWIWSALCSVWVIWTWWALPVAILLMFFSYSWVLQAAKTYSTLLETAFDVYRPLLYQTLRFPLPEDPATEVEAGNNLTAYLLRGTKGVLRFETAPDSE